VLKLLNTFKGIAQAQLGSGESILFWEDIRNGQILKSSFLELHSYVLNGNISVKTALHMDSLEDLFHLPLSVQVFDQYYELEIMLQSLHITEDNDIWIYIWRCSQYSASKAYNIS
jgi:hypothetical protein